MGYFYIKRFFDIIIAIGALVLLSPVAIIFGIIIFINYGKIFFAQVRPGLKGKLFTVYKFKTMNDRRGPNGELLPDHIRLDKLGKFIRKTSIDELPQLWNVLKGNMSIVGPRPLLPQYLLLYNERQAKRHDVRPGITGWAQVNGRNAISWEEKFELDVWYVEHQSFMLDCKILLRTCTSFFRTHEVNMKNHATAEPFKGNI